MGRTAALLTKLLGLGKRKTAKPAVKRNVQRGNRKRSTNNKRK
jgi:hypothetical protein